MGLKVGLITGKRSSPLNGISYHYFFRSLPDSVESGSRRSQKTLPTRR